MSSLPSSWNSSWDDISSASDDIDHTEVLIESKTRRKKRILALVIAAIMLVIIGVIVALVLF